MAEDEAPLEIEPVGFDIRMGDIDRPVVLASEGAPSPVLLRLDRNNKQQLRVWMTTSASAAAKVFLVDEDHTLGDMAMQHISWRPERAFLLPEGRLHTHMTASRMALWALLALTATLVAIGFMLGEALGPGPGLAVLMGAPLCLGLITLLRRRSPLTRYTYEVDGVDHPVDQLLDTRPALRAADKTVEQIREDYGALLTDLVYRLENPALFDAAEPATADFVNLMIRWDNNRSLLAPSQVSDLAANLTVAFKAARANAEAKGLTHVPEAQRPQVDRAARIMRTATDGATPAHERRAATQRAAQILQELALYYLPQPDQMEQLLGGKTPKALPGRWSES